ncbi:hypothetical protein FRC09_000654 [Ceratobasidium sp. 395]|nr:hypothetical protein FRC09_000654 [Ceratobasidium sp. 395]
MNGPLSLQKGYEISIPTNDWEKVNGSVNEGPAPITHNGRTWIVYSASHCKGPGYSLASLELVGSDPLQMSSWKKSNGTIFTSANGNWALNWHFVRKVYHAYPVPKVRCDDGRQTLAQPIGFNADGSLDLGEPGPRSEDIPEPK